MARAAPVEIPAPVAPGPEGEGQGLCVANAVSTQPSLDFPQQPGVFNSGLNAFIEVHKADRVEYVQRTVFDLSNNVSFGADKRSYGDFEDAGQPACKTGGCAFFQNDTTTSFGARFRGFLSVTGDLAQKPMHLGFYADDAVSLTIYDKTGNAHAVVTQPPNLGFPTWRMTETVTFGAPGLYPLEVLYAQIGEHAALEMSFFDGAFTDFQRPYNQVPVVSLSSAGFTLFPRASFFQTLSGNPSYADLTKCMQCDRQYVGKIGNNGCDSGYYCNEAALCAPCDSAVYCGPSCSPCGGDTPFCINLNGQYGCAGCRTDLDCDEDCSCDPATHTCGDCKQCYSDSDCPRGHACEANQCEVCDGPDQCAGTSCNCCPKGLSGESMQCAALREDALPECVECLTNQDCQTGVCDMFTGQCVEALAANEKASCCGDDCVACPSDYPFCLPGSFGTVCAQCRQDMQCPEGNYCLAGTCTECLADRRCGPRCGSCGGDTPYCLATQLVDDALCVRCNTDDQCGAGNRCTKEHDCERTCAMSCTPEAPHCDGVRCVECYADTQCPCGGTCDPTTHTCSKSCKDNTNCLGDQHCRYADDGQSKECAPGPMVDNTACGSTLADICAGTNSIGSRGANPTPADGIFGVSLLALLLRRRSRGRR